MRTLGLDPGLVLGFGVVESDGARLRCLAYGVVRTERDHARSSREDLDRRLGVLIACVGEIVAVYRPDRAGIEEFRFHARHVASSIALGAVVGALKALLRERGLPYVERSAQELKRAVTGSRLASKAQVQRMTQAILGLEKHPTPHHAADALAAAIAATSRLAIEEWSSPR